MLNDGDSFSVDILQNGGNVEIQPALTSNGKVGTFDYDNTNAYVNSWYSVIFTIDIDKEDIYNNLKIEFLGQSREFKVLSQNFKSLRISGSIPLGDGTDEHNVLVDIDDIGIKTSSDIIFDIEVLPVLSPIGDNQNIFKIDGDANQITQHPTTNQITIKNNDDTADSATLTITLIEDTKIKKFEKSSTTHEIISGTLQVDFEDKESNKLLTIELENGENIKVCNKAVTGKGDSLIGAFTLDVSATSDDKATIKINDNTGFDVERCENQAASLSEIAAMSTRVGPNSEAELRGAAVKTKSVGGTSGSDSSKSKKKLKGGAVAGIIVGAIALVGIISLVVCCCGRSGGSKNFIDGEEMQVFL